jgi:tRNA dimethylallyltransferase
VTSSMRPRATADIITVVGPTAVGKSAFALDLAERIDGEIVNADSMQGYIGMDIGTAKPSAEQRRRVRHHLVDMWSTLEEISVVEFRQAARIAVTDILTRGRTPIVVGGSWLYVQAIVDEIDFPPTDPVIRARWERELARVGPQALHDQLRQRDSQVAADIAPGNGRRIVRALEVLDLTGSFQARLPQPRSWRATTWLGLDVPRGELDDRIEQRVDMMWSAGFVDEVIRMRQAGLGRTAAQALGYAQIGRYLDGEIDQDAARAATIRATVKFARRQQRRFRQDGRIHWVNPKSPLADTVAYLSSRTAT